MDRLWSPWRYRYVSHAADDSGVCIFCDKATAAPESGGELRLDGAGNGARDKENLILWRGRHTYALLNLYPYTTGHLMVTPYAHMAELSAVPAETLAEMMALAQHAERILKQVYRCDGLNVGMNLGRAAGAGIAAHIHLHVLPRWFADANFMTTIGESRVIPEDLETTWGKLQPLFQDMSRDSDGATDSR
jgi:ATP adenylyltransferase